MRGRAWVLYALAGALAATIGRPSATAAETGLDEWPRFWGARGDAQAAEPKAPPGSGLSIKELWRRPLGSGFSGIAVVKGRGYTGESDGTDDLAVAFNADDGKTLWRTRLGATYKGHDGSRDGPVSTPTVDDGRVFMTGPHGGLFALDAASGRVLWQKDLKADMGAALPFYGFGSSPVVADNRVVVQVGAAEKNGLAAFDAATGRVLWTVYHGNTTGYSTPVPTAFGGIPQLVILGNDSVYAVKPEDGALLWTHKLSDPEEPQRPPIALDGSRLLIPRGGAAILINVAREGDAFKVEERWRSPRFKGSLSPGVLHEGHLYGFNAQYLVCLDATSGDVKWRQKVNPGALVMVGRHLLVLGEQSGLLRVVEAAPEGYKQVAEHAAFNAGATSYTHPSIAKGRAYLRNLEEMVAVELVVARPAQTSDAGSAKEAIQ